ncbi:hypothetical protein [Haloarchaeobius sp. HRN-SO-5]|uniref:hypothetical protein n=1 Tax=Haloarchaeobius sp. HRN-SO-5 TaxID=3446118 RepID=UPI003EB81EDC
MSGARSSTPSTTTVLIGGYLALAVGVTAALLSPAGGYELSIYANTPLLFWLGLVAAFVAAAVAGFVPSASSRRRLAATALVWLAGISFAGLPIVRGYYFFGSGDSLSHLGWARELADGSLRPGGLLYPGLHELTVVLGEVLGLPYRRTMLYAVLTFVAVFLVFVPLCVRLISGRRDGLLVGAFVAAMLAPINVISTHLVPHTSSQAILFAPFVLFLILVYLRQPGRNAVLNPVTGVGALLAIGAATSLLVHPQQAANLLVLFGGVAVFQFLARQFAPESYVAGHRPLYVQASAFAGMFALWAPRFERVGGNTSAIIYNIVQQGGESGSVVNQKSTSITAVGGSIPELFVKLFLTGTVLSLLAGVLITVALLGWLSEDDPHRNAMVVYLGFALVPLSGLFFVVFLGGPGDMYFRYQGFLMVITSVLGAVALVRAFGERGLGYEYPSASRVLLTAVVLSMIPLAVLSAFPSPYVYQANSQVTELQYEGYQFAFDVRGDGVEFTGIRGGPQRYVDAVYGTDQARDRLDFPGYEDAVSPRAFKGGLGYRYKNHRYFVLTDGTRPVEVGLYDELRFSRDGFQRLHTTPGVNRVVSNGGFELYYLRGDGDTNDPGDDNLSVEAAENRTTLDEDDAGNDGQVLPTDLLTGGFSLALPSDAFTIHVPAPILGGAARPV